MTNNKNNLVKKDRYTRFTSFSLLDKDGEDYSLYILKTKMDLHHGKGFSAE